VLAIAGAESRSGARRRLVEGSTPQQPEKRHFSVVGEGQQGRQEGVARSKHEGHVKMANQKPVTRKRRNECGGIIM